MYISLGNAPIKGINNRLNPCRFYYRQQLNVARSQTENTKIYEDTLYVQIGDPLDKFTQVDRPATDADKERYAIEYSLFEQKTKAAKDGISIDVLFPRASAAAMTLREQGIHTVEQLVDTVIPGNEYLCEKAKRYLIYIKESDKFHQYEGLLDEKNREISALKAKIENLSRQFQGILNAQERVKTQGFIDSNAKDAVGYDSQQAQIIANAEELVKSIRGTG